MLQAVRRVVGREPSDLEHRLEASPDPRRDALLVFGHAARPGLGSAPQGETDPPCRNASLAAPRLKLDEHVPECVGHVYDALDARVFVVPPIWELTVIFGPTRSNFSNVRAIASVQGQD